MIRLGLFLALTLSLPAVAQSCDMGGFTLEDFTDHIVVTNAGTSQTATVLLHTTQGDAMEVLPPGASRTVNSVLAASYTASVIPLTAGMQTYQERLTLLREDLVALTTNPDRATADTWVALAQVQDALAQLGTAPATGDLQLPTCTRKIASGIDSHVTVAWHTVPNNVGYWSLSCG